MRPLHLIPIFFLVAVVAGASVYLSYPLDADESYGVIDIALANESVRGVPGFAAGAASVTAEWRSVTIEGLIISHGFVEVRGVRVPFMKVDTGDRVYIVVMGKRVAGQISGGSIVELPMMAGHRVTVEGLLLNDSNVVVARRVSMDMGPVGGPMGPMHGWRDR